MAKMGSPTNVIKRSSPGAKPRPSLLEALTGQVKYEEEEIKRARKSCLIEGFEGEAVKKDVIKMAPGIGSHRDMKYIAQLS